VTIVRTREPSSARPATDATFGAGLKVAHVATRYLRGGSERRIVDIVGALPGAEHHLIVGTESDTELARDQVRSASLTVLPALVRRPHPYLDLVALRRLVRTLRGGGFDVVVTHQSKAGVLGRTAARVAGVPVVHCLSMPSFGPGYPGWQSALFRVVERRLARSTDAFAVVGTDVARRYHAIGVSPDKLHVVRSGVRLPNDVRRGSDEDPRGAYALPLDRPLVLYLGSLEPRKNVLDLPRVLAGLVRSMPAPPPHLVIAGDGPLASRMNDALDEMGVADHATYLGYVTDPLSLVRAADVVVLLSEAEGVPQVLVQAAALGTPFVAYRVDGVEELIALGADGVSVEPGDIDGVTRATSSTLRHGRVTSPPAIDLTPWQPDAIVNDYRNVFAHVLRGAIRADGRPTERIPSHG
jgi:glycosyltransferase involved in cell wall biosynthesis